MFHAYSERMGGKPLICLHAKNFHMRYQLENESCLFLISTDRPILEITLVMAKESAIYY